MARKTGIIRSISLIVRYWFYHRFLYRLRLVRESRAPFPASRQERLRSGGLGLSQVFSQLFQGVFPALLHVVEVRGGHARVVLFKYHPGMIAFFIEGHRDE